MEFGFNSLEFMKEFILLGAESLYFCQWELRLLISCQDEVLSAADAADRLPLTVFYCLL